MCSHQHREVYNIMISVKKFPRGLVLSGAVRVLFLEHPLSGLLLDPVPSSLPLVPVVSAAPVPVSPVSVAPPPAPAPPPVPVPAPPPVSVPVPAPVPPLRPLLLDFILQIAETAPLWIRTLNINQISRITDRPNNINHTASASSIELASQLSADWLQMHEVTKA